MPIVIYPEMGYTYSRDKGRGVTAMMVTLDFRKNYQEQTEEVKKAISEHDFYEVANLVGFKVRLKKMRKNKKKG